MSPKLKPLLLPQLVEERRKRESMSDSEADLATSHTHTSSTSEAASPVTPTFSARHMRYPSSASSIESTYHASVVADSPASPSFIAKASKRSLPDVIEEIQEKEEDFNMFEEARPLYDCLCKCNNGKKAVAKTNSYSLQVITHIALTVRCKAQDFYHRSRSTIMTLPTVSSVTTSFLQSRGEGRPSRH